MSLYSKKGEHTYYTNYGMFGSGISEGYINAPTQSLLQKWFWETYGIYISIIPIKHKEAPTIYFQFRLIDFRNEIEEVLFEHQYDIDFEECITPRKALEKGLQEALKLI